MVRLSKEKREYLADVSVAASQVFLGIAAVTLFTGNLNIIKVVNILINAGITVIFWFSGSKILK